MHRLSIYTKLLSFFVVIHGGFVLAMEQEQAGSIKNIKDLRAQLSVRDTKMFNLIDDLMCLPIKYAIKKLMLVDDDWMAKNENRVPLIELIKLHKLDDDVASVIVEKLEDLPLARQLAQEGAITTGVASIIVKDFLKTDITACLSDFDGIFHKAFPEKILSHGNYGAVYKALMDAMTDDYSFAVDIVSTDSFFLHDFNNASAPVKTSSGQVSCTRKVSGGDFSVTLNDKHFIGMYNKATRLGFRVFFPVEVVNLAFKKDDVTLFGILDAFGNIYELVMPVALLQAEMPLRQLASLVYCKAQVYGKAIPSTDCMGYTIFTSLDLQEEGKLIQYMQDELQDEWVPHCLRGTLKRDEKHLYEVATLRGVFDYMSYALRVTRKQVAIDLYIKKSDTAWSTFYRKYPDWATQSLIQRFEQTFVNDMY